MIHRVYADDTRFKDLTFRPGLNIVLAEKSPGASTKQTRNGAGKSSFVEVVHFLLGSSDQDRLFRSPLLKSIRFGMEFDLGTTVVRVERAGTKHSRVQVEGDFSGWSVAPQKTKDGGFELSNDDWKAVLGQQMFGLPVGDEKGRPAFRSLLAYFLRRASGGMNDPLKHFGQQKLADQQVLLSFLLGLDWTLPQRWRILREREEGLMQLKKSVGDELLGEHIGTSAELRTQRILAENDLQQLQRDLASFKVLDSYHDVEREASLVTAKLGELANASVVDRRYLAELRHVSISEVPPAPADLQALYTEAGVSLPGLVVRRFDEAAAFHASVVKNRRAYLQSEIELTEQRLADRDREQRQLDERRAELMTLLATTGALEHYTRLQTELVRRQTRLERLRQRYESAEALESTGSKLRIERERLLDRLRQDYSEQDAQIREAVLTFRDISAQLYEREREGRLTIEPTENGPKFDPYIPAEKSRGVNNMRIFCFDMMLMLLSLRRGRSPGFLIHDSHLFDGVDERQVGKALALGRDLAAEHGFQYIVTMNTDAVPRELPFGFRVEDHTLPVRLSDTVETGGLFGFRFELPRSPRSAPKQPDEAADPTRDPA